VPGGAEHAFVRADGHDGAQGGRRGAGAAAGLGGGQRGAAARRRRRGQRAHVPAPQDRLQRQLDEQLCDAEAEGGERVGCWGGEGVDVEGVAEEDGEGC